MKLRTNLACLLSISIYLTAGSAPGQPPAQDNGSARTLQALVDAAARTTVEKFADKNLKPDQLSITVIDLRDVQHPVTASYRGNERIYPASVVKLFYLAATHRWLEDKKIAETPELRRAVKDMIVDSSNE